MFTNGTPRWTAAGLKMGLVSCCRPVSRTKSIQDHGIGSYQTCDILEFLLTQISELDVNLTANLVIGGRGDTDAPGFGDALKACCDITPSPRMSSPWMRIRQG